MACFVIYTSTNDTTNTYDVTDDDTTVTYIHENDPQFVNDIELPDEGALKQEEADEAKNLLLDAPHATRELYTEVDRPRGVPWPIIARARCPGVCLGGSGAPKACRVQDRARRAGWKAGLPSHRRQVVAFSNYRPVDGDILFVKGIGYNHVAIVYLDRESIGKEWWVYEAWINPRRAIRVPLNEWLARWDKRIFRVAGARLSVYRGTIELTPEMRGAMYWTANDRLGTPYNWLANFAFKLARFDHCVEYIVWQLKSVGLSFKWEPSRVSPNRLRPVLLQSGLYTFYDHTVGNAIISTGAPLIRPRARWRYRGYLRFRAWGERRDEWLDWG